MSWKNKFSTSLSKDLITIASGALGAAIGYLLHLPLYVLIGPAILVTLLNLNGLQMEISKPVRDAAFLVLGISIGSGLDANSIDAVFQWPIAFFALAMMLVIILFAGTYFLSRFFQFGSYEAILATSPGHLSFVISIGLETVGDATRIMVIQSIRLLALTLCVPFIALLFGIDAGDNVLPPGETIEFKYAMPLVLFSALAGYVFLKLNVPAAYVIGGMVVSSIGHLTGLTPGVLPVFIVLPSFIVLGCLIGSQFSGITFEEFWKTITAGLLVVILIVALACLFAVPVALLLSMPMLQVILAFAPGGLETMMVMGAVLGVNPGFLAACHVARLFILSFLVPLMLSTLGKSKHG